MKKSFFFALILPVTLLQAQVGIGTTSPNENALLDVSSTVSNPGGMLLPRLALNNCSDAAPLSAHVEGMFIYNTATAGDVYPGLYVNQGTRWVRVEDLSPVASSTSLSGDQQMSSPTYAAVNGISDLTFTARKSEVLVQLTASGFAYTNSMAYVQFRVWNVSNSASVGGTATNMQSYDDVTGTTTAWSASFSKVLSGLTVGTSYTLRVQAKVDGILGTYNAAIFESSFPDEHHLTLSVIH